VHDHAGLWGRFTQDREQPRRGLPESEQGEIELAGLDDRLCLVGADIGRDPELMQAMLVPQLAVGLGRKKGHRPAALDQPAHEQVQPYGARVAIDLGEAWLRYECAALTHPTAPTSPRAR